MDEKSHLLDDSFEKYRTLVIRNAYLFVKNYHTAEDICQEAFVRLGENLDKIPPENIKAWLICVSERLALDFLKKGGKYETLLSPDGMEYEAITATDMDLSSLMVQKEEIECRASVLKELEKERPLWYKAIIMCYLEGMDNSSIGRALGVKAGLVSKWKERGKKWLEEHYEATFGEKSR